MKKIRIQCNIYLSHQRTFSQKSGILFKAFALKAFLRARASIARISYGDSVLVSVLVSVTTRY